MTNYFDVDEAEEIITRPRRGSASRKAKVDAGKGKIVKPKFQEERDNAIYQIQAKTENQQKFMDALKSKQLVVGSGDAGVGKSFLACVHAANQYLKGECDKIVLLRPYVQVGKTAGMLPGTLHDKLYPLMVPMLDNLRLVLGHERFKYLLEHDIVQMESLENVRGRSYKNSIVIVDESQNTTVQEINALVTRLEEDSQMILIGDAKQTDIRGENGISFLTKKIKELKVDKPSYLDAEDLDVLFNNTACVTFTQEDIVRSGLTKMFCKVFDNL